ATRPRCSAGNEKAALVIGGQGDEGERILWGGVLRRHLDSASFGHGETIVAGCSPYGLAPRIGLPVGAENSYGQPLAIIEVTFFPALGCGLRTSPGLVTDLGAARRAVGHIADAHQQTGRSVSVLCLN